ncbi:hypothetical protein VB151_18685 [Xanthomonas fragariae]|uniref:hypothetical protein n=1 Tax=Xanthomonas fragariae TaxID=48664 RepID=UPI000326F4C3|nr:hypothetical protein [Xanthomonas fragariae]AOD16080.1 hypothetical protein BER92_17040 [Xanthomonas fragariae]AOD19509.1 hypothetical protein BER93_17095 [Xanthomonas fragariae]ENZ96761.1 hypothetical protein O1K_03061 [Xanthomonas fragariae LMG 25863]MBL9197273.1 hypothetical protein [Xanthomonas fragariae]MBL9222221.1 hypothetical protein [Xanthomonas fragariae]
MKNLEEETAARAVSHIATPNNTAMGPYRFAIGDETTAPLWPARGAARRTAMRALDPISVLVLVDQTLLDTQPNGKATR